MAVGIAFSISGGRGGTLIDAAIERRPAGRSSVDQPPRKAVLVTGKYRSISILATVIAVLSLLVGADTGAAEAQTARSPVLITSADVSRIKSSIASNAAAQSYNRDLLARAEEQLKTSPETYRLPDGIRLLNISRSVLDRSLTLGMAYRLTGDTRFSDRLWRELDAATKFKDWNPAHFLDTAEMAAGVAIGYDWIYDRLSSAQRTQITSAIHKLAFAPANQVFSAPENSPGPFQYGGNWSQLTNNWNVVVNSSLILASIAVGVENSSEARSIQQKSLASIRRGLSAFGPDGGYAEGYAYWDYASRYAAMAITGLRSAYGTDYDLSLVGGVSRAGDFALYGTDSNGRSFNFGDSDVRATNSPAMLAFGRIYKRADLVTAGVSASDSTQPALRLLWLDTSLIRSESTSTAPLDANFIAARVATLRSSWSDPLGNFIGFRTGRVPTSPHQNLDAGTFYLTSQGEEWAAELQKDEYNLKGYFDDGAAGEGWNYYRKRGEGQNTLVINPLDPNLGQGWNASVPSAVKMQSSPSSAFATAQLDAVYTDQNVKWSRGVALVNGRSEFIVQDEVSSSTPVEAMWAMHTRADVRISEDGRTAMLYQNGKRLRAVIESAAGTKFVVADASPLPSSPNPTQTSNDGWRKLSIFVPAGTATTVTVRFTPSAEGAIGTMTAQPLKNWTAPNNSGNELKYVSVDGKWVAGYRAGVRHYTVYRDPSLPLPRLSAAGATGSKISIVAPKKVPGTASVTVTDGAGRSDLYVVRFLPEPIAFAGSVTASYTKEGEPRLTIDGDESSFWATWGDRSIQWDLGAARDLRALQVAWKGNKNKKTKFEVETSFDGVRWSRTHDEWANGDSPQTTSVFPSGTKLRYVRLQVHGDTTSDLWSAIRDVQFLAWNPAESGAPGATAVPPVAMRGVPANMTAGETAQGFISVGGAPPSSSQTVKFVSGDAAVLAAAQDGKVTATGAGTARVGALVFLQGEVKFAATTVTVADPTRIRVFSSGDAYVQGGASAGMNFGNEKSLFSKPTPKGWNDSATSRYAYVAFNIGALRGKTILSATLNVSGSHVDSVGDSTRVDAHAVSGSWAETGVTFANKPVLGERLGSAVFTKTNDYQAFDVSDAVRSRAAAGGAWMHLGLSQDINSYTPRLVRFDSEESPSKPYIDIVFDR